MRIRLVPVYNCTPQGEENNQHALPIEFDETGKPLGIARSDWKGNDVITTLNCGEHTSGVSTPTEFRFSYPHPGLAGETYLGIKVECTSSTCDRCRR